MPDMTTIAEVMQGFGTWNQLRNGQAGGNAFRLRCSVSAPAPRAEIEMAWQGHHIPNELLELWLAGKSARLFEDIEYRQWGLVILSPTAASGRTALERELRPKDMRPDDFIIGEFLGDQELLLLAPSEPGLRRVLIALPLDGRPDWYPAAPTLVGFLRLYLRHEGSKYWEQ